jgi:hypothetical protein
VDELSIPGAALDDGASVEMIRVWIASKRLHCSIKVGMYQESSKVREQKAWGIILADVARHVASALESGYGMDRQSVLHEITRAFNSELAQPTSPVEGQFVGGSSKMRGET